MLHALDGPLELVHAVLQLGGVVAMPLTLMVPMVVAPMVVIGVEREELHSLAVPIEEPLRELTGLVLSDEHP